MHFHAYRGMMAGKVCTQGTTLMTLRLTFTFLCFQMQLAGASPTPETDNQSSCREPASD